MTKYYPALELNNAGAPVGLLKPLATQKFMSRIGAQTEGLQRCASYYLRNLAATYNERLVVVEVGTNKVVCEFMPDSCDWEDR